MEKTLGTQRLEMLADHLEKGELAQKDFDFTRYSNTKEDNVCGTAGCALGECPALWPDEWQWQGASLPGWVGQVVLIGGWNAWTSAMRFFEISQDAAFHLFMPDRQAPDKYGGNRLQSTANRYEVASNIREFIKKCRS